MSHIRLVSLFFIILAVFATTATAQELFPGGTENKAAGVPSALGCEGPTCLGYNPANLSGSGATPYVEAGMVLVHQSYEHPNFDTVKVKVTSPIASFGASHRLTSLPLSYGIYVLPLSYGKQKINGLPRRIAGSFESLYVENESNMYDVVLGSSYDVSDVVTIGASVIRRSEQRKIFATRVNEDTALIRYDGHNVFYIPTFGLNITPTPWGKFGISYRTAKLKNYKGRQKAATDDEITKPRNINYDPAVLYSSLSLSLIKQWTFRLNVNRYFASKGRNKVREGLTNQVKKADLNDIDERSIEVIYQAWDNIGFSLAYGVSPSPWGAGHYSETANEHIIGNDFGSANGVTRRTYALGMRYSASQDTKIAASYFDSYGKREIGPQGDKPGFYQSHTQALSLSVERSF